MYETMKKPNGYAILRNLYLNWLIQPKMQRFLFRFLRISKKCGIYFIDPQILMKYFYWNKGWVQILSHSFAISKKMLTHLFPMHPFSTSWKHQKNLRFSDVFRGKRKGALGTNGLIRSLSGIFKNVFVVLRRQRRIQKSVKHLRWSFLRKHSR